MNARARSKKGPASSPADVLEALGPEWFDVVCSRKSRRSYDGVRLDDEVLSSLKETCHSFRPFSDARVELWENVDADLFRGVIGSYGKVVGAPHVLAVIASASDTSQWHAGYTGEACILDATRRALGTCWVGGFFKHEDANRVADVRDGERVVALSPLGYPASRQSFSERFLREASRAHDRKPIEHITVGLDDSWPCWARAAVECARLAPSAVNRQPWRFRMSAGRLVIARDSRRDLPSVTKALDCGIAMLHAELGARAAGMVGEWRECEDADLDLACFETKA